MHVSPFEYLYYLIRFPRYKEYLDMGYGIEARYRKCKKFWDPHLQCTKEFIQHSIGDKKYNSIAVLGSGKLLDIDVDYLLSHFHEVQLFDADPRAISHVKKRFKDNAQVKSSVTEIHSSKDLREKKFSVVVSLNILSQLGHYNRSHTQEEHLTILQAAAIEKIIIIADRFWHFYNVQNSNWETENAVDIEWDKISMLGSIEQKDSWFWHIIPPGIEEHDCGSIHEVHAFAVDVNDIRNLKRNSNLHQSNED